MYSSSIPTVYGAPVPKRWSRTSNAAASSDISDRLRLHLDRPARALLHAQRAALAVVEIEGVGVRAARLELDHGIVGTDAVAVVAGEAAPARQAAPRLEQRGGGVEAAGDLVEGRLAAGGLDDRADRPRRVVVVPGVQRVERSLAGRRIRRVVRPAQERVDPAGGV